MNIFEFRHRQEICMNNRDKAYIIRDKEAFEGLNLYDYSLEGGDTAKLMRGACVWKFIKIDTLYRYNHGDIRIVEQIVEQLYNLDDDPDHNILKDLKFYLDEMTARQPGKNHSNYMIHLLQRIDEVMGGELIMLKGGRHCRRKSKRRKSKRRKSRRRR
jgi:hypothetical protein